MAKKLEISVSVKLPSGTPIDLSQMDSQQIASLKPNECIYLLARFADALRRSELDSVRDADAWQVLGRSEYSISRGVCSATALSPPVILVASTAHYSIGKAAQVLGIGRENVWPVPVDGRFRINVKALRLQIQKARKLGMNPFCVVASLGTTEEGSVDPVDEIADMRAEMEHESNFSFWLHVDAAWGGFIRSLYCLEDRDHAREVIAKAASVLGLGAPDDDLSAWQDGLASSLEARLKLDEGNASSEASDSRELAGTGSVQVDAALPGTSLGAGDGEDHTHGLRRRNRIRDVVGKMRKALDAEDYMGYVELLESLPIQLRGALDLGIDASALSWTFDDFHRELAAYVSSEFTLQLDRHRKDYLISWPSRDVCAAFMRVNAAESVTIDPHKMGYVPYPSGAVAFKNDRVRHFVRQEAPYITAKNQSQLVHRPPIHRTGNSGASEIHRDAFGPFILDGSRPGAAASALWLSTRSVPLTRFGHGSVVRASVLAAKALYEWLTQWVRMHQKMESDIDYTFVALTDRGPDTNLVTFVVKKRTSSSLLAMNTLTEAVYRRFTIEAELGDMEYSYSQPFFLSRTVMTDRVYGPSEIKPFAQRAQLARSWARDYNRHGLTVLRAAVMNPYLTPLRELGKDDLVRTFVETLARVSASEVKAL